MRAPGIKRARVLSRARLEARVPELWRPSPGGKSGSWLVARPLCTAMEELWLSQFGTSAVTQAELQKGANGCCYGPLPQHLLRGDTLLSVPPRPAGCSRKSVKLFQILPPPDSLLNHKLMKDKCSHLIWNLELDTVFLLY